MEGQGAKPETLKGHHVKRSSLLTRTALLAALCAPLPTMAATPALPVFDAANFAAPRPNAYFPLVAPAPVTFAGTFTAEDGSTLPFTRIRTVVGPGPVVLGVPTTAIRDDEYEGPNLTESSTDYYATDKDGAVWYFGEDVRAFTYDAAGRLTGEGPGPSWIAGKDAALPGIILRAQPDTSEVLFRAHAPKAQEMEFSTVVAVGLTETVPAGTFADVVKVYTESAADPGLREYSYWAKGIGLVRTEEDLSASQDHPLIVSARKP